MIELEFFFSFLFFGFTTYDYDVNWRFFVSKICKVCLTFLFAKLEPDLRCRGEAVDFFGLRFRERFMRITVKRML